MYEGGWGRCAWRLSPSYWLSDRVAIGPLSASVTGIGLDGVQRDRGGGTAMEKSRAEPKCAGTAQKHAHVHGDVVSDP